MAEPPGPGEPSDKPLDSSDTIKNVIIVVCVIALFIIPTLVVYVTLPSCPASCDDGNPCTADSCDQEAKDCRHTPLSGMQGACSGGAGLCKERSCEAGMCVESIVDDCCGNGVCEGNETYGSCIADCKTPPDEVCDDGADNDFDDLVDCDDPDCDCVADSEDDVDDEEPDEEEVDCCDPDADCDEDCGDGEDNDCDGLADCDDPDCETECITDCTELIMINEFRSEFGDAVMGEEEDDCEAIPGDWRGKVNEVGCYAGDLEEFDCEDIEEDVRYFQFMQFCEETLNAEWECQNNYWGCLCDEEPPDEAYNGPYCDDVDSMSQDLTCPDYPCQDADDSCRPVYGLAGLTCACVEETDEGSNCGDDIDNDNDGAIDCMDPDCCPGSEPCCCEDFFNSPDWTATQCYPECEDCFCYEGDCVNVGGECECVETLPCESIDPKGPEDCELGVCRDSGRECVYTGYNGDAECSCMYDCSGGDNPDANADSGTCSKESWCMDFGMPCQWYENGRPFCGCPMPQLIT